MVDEPGGSAARDGEVGGDADARRADRGAATRLRLLHGWLRDHPGALVAAVGPDGLSRPIPAVVRLGPGHHVEDRSLLDLVVSEDRSKVTLAYITATQHGVGATSARLADDPTKVVAIDYVDLRPAAPVCIRLMAPESPPSGSTEAPPWLGPDGLRTSRPRVGTLTKDEVSQILGVDGGTVAMLGWRAEQLVGRQTLELIHPDDHGRAIDNWMQMLHGGGPQAVRLRYLCADGSWLWLETSNDLRCAPDGTAVAECQVIDISEEMAASDALRRNEQLLRRLTETVPVGLCFLGTDRSVDYVNPELARLLGTGAVGDLAALQGRLRPEEASALARCADDALLVGRDSELEVTLARGDAPALRCRVMLSAVEDRGATIGALLCFVDVTELKVQATVDHLTGLLNRASILSALDVALAVADGWTGVVFVDLDLFKPVNDEHGHRVGDRLLASVAARLTGALRRNDETGRLGGDEFLVVCPGLDRPEDLEPVAARVKEALDAPVDVEGISLTVTASVGMAATVGRSRRGEQLVADADAAMYVAKRRRTPQPVWSPRPPAFRPG